MRASFEDSGSPWRAGLSAYAYLGPLCRAFTLLLISAFPAFGQEIEVFSTRDSVVVGEPFELVVVARHGIMTEPAFPAPESGFGGEALDVLEQTHQSHRYGGPESPGLRVDSVRYRVAAFALDTLTVPPIPIGFVQGADTLFAYSPSLLLKVVRLVPEDADALRPMQPLQRFPRPLWLYAVLAVGVLAGALLGWWLLRRRPRPAPVTAPPPEQTPYEVALARLHRLETAHLAEAAQVKPFYVELTEALRAYFEHRPGIPALESTSTELLRQLRRADVPPELPGLVREILDVADLAKFADLIPPPDAGRAALEKAFRTLHLLEAQRRPEPLAERPA